MPFPFQFAFEFPAPEMHFGVWHGRELSVWARFAGPLVGAISLIVVFTRYFLGTTYIVGGMGGGDAGAVAWVVRRSVAERTASA